MKPKAIAYRHDDGAVLIVISLDGKRVWRTTEDARSSGYDILYR